MKTAIFKKNLFNKKGVENFYLSNGTNKSIANFRETIPLSPEPWTVMNTVGKVRALSASRPSGTPHVDIGLLFKM
jgi:hypothetical protein